MNINFKQLRTEGYIIISDFLNQEEVSLLAQDYVGALDSNNKNYSVSTCNKETLEILQPKLKNLMKMLSVYAGIYTDAIVSSGYFSTDKIEFSWHQDHEPYYKWQDSYNSLNFWIPIIKPNDTRSGLDVISFKSLEAADLIITKKRLVGKGAKSFIPQGNTTLVNDHDAGGQFTLNVNLDDIKHSLIIKPGDLLLMRHDVIHKTQDAIDTRVALSIRAINSNGKIYKDKFYTQCDRKIEMINNNRSHYDDIINIFQTQDSCVIKELLTKDTQNDKTVR